MKHLYLTLALVFAASLTHAGEPADNATPGLIVSIGDGSDTWIKELGMLVTKQRVVHGLCTRPEKVTAARQALAVRPEYGRISVAPFSGDALPYADRLVNLLIVSKAEDIPEAEMKRVLVPYGRVIDRTGEELYKAPWPKTIDEWTHFLRHPDNNAVAADTEVGPPRSLRWKVGPLFSRSHEELASTSAAVTNNGRIFYIQDESPVDTIRYMPRWKLIARDAFNGILLWKKPIGKWIDHLRHFRSGPVHLPRRLVAVDDVVYATLGLDAPVVALDARNGKILKTYAGTEHTEEILVQDGVLYLATGTSEVQRVGKGLHTRGEPKPTGFRRVVAIDAASGKQLWAKDCVESDFLLPLSLAVSKEWTVYQTLKGIVCAKSATGEIVRTIERPTQAKRQGFWAATVVLAGDVLLVADRDVPDNLKDSKVTWAVNGWSEKGFQRVGKSTITAYELASGKSLWSKPAREGYNAPVDVFLIDGIVWVGQNFGSGYKLRTGEEVTMNAQGERVGMVHPRCYRNKATPNWIFTCRDGIELLEVGKGWKENDSWVRGVCQYGIMPANGLLYAPPDACACNSQVKVQGWNVLSAKLPPTATQKVQSIKNPLVKGPAFDKTAALLQVKGQPDDWPMYRANLERGGATTAAIQPGLKHAWSIPYGRKLTQPVVGNDHVYLAVTDQHTVHALDINTGKSNWHFVAGGRIDSAPTLHGGLLFFGAADGWLYCLDAKTGDLAWQQRLAPMEQTIMVFGQLESSWPVHGSPLLYKGELYATAGRNSYLDGGIYFYRIDPATGEIRARNLICHRDPVTGKYDSPQGRFDMVGTRSDILSADGDSLYLAKTRLDRDGNEMPKPRMHLYTPTGFLGEEWFVRSYWLYGTFAGTGWGGWARGGTSFFSGRILSFDAKTIYGYGRKVVRAGATGHKSEDYHFFGGELNRTSEPVVTTTKPKKGKKPRKTSKYPPLEYKWSMPLAIQARAMALTRNHVLVAGTPDVAKKDAAHFAFSNDQETRDALAGKKGAFLTIHVRDTGKEVLRIPLKTAPIFDSLIAARGRVFLCTEDGQIHCWSSGTGKQE